MQSPFDVKPDKLLIQLKGKLHQYLLLSAAHSFPNIFCVMTPEGQGECAPVAQSNYTD